MAKILYFVTGMDPLSMELASSHKSDEVGICLLQDAVFFACKGRIDEAIKQGVKVYANKKDIKLRGLTKLLHQEAKILDYDEIIDLTFSYEKIINM